MANKHQQPGFTFETNIATYNAQFKDSVVGEEHWKVDVRYNSSEKVLGTFTLPIKWSREQVFCWLSQMELSEVECQMLSRKL